MDLGFQGGARSPGFDFDLVEAGGGREADEAVALDTVTVPGVDGVNLKEKVGTVGHLRGLSEELIVEWEAEVGREFCGIFVFWVGREFYSALGHLSNTLPLIKIVCFFHWDSLHFIIIIILVHPPTFRQQQAVHYVGRLSLESGGGHDLTSHEYSVAQVIFLGLAGLGRGLRGLLLWGDEEPCTY